MVLEACMLVIDNSEYMRNGDYLTSRYQAQLDTVELIFRRKTNSNPETTVGLMTMAGESPRVISNLTTEYGKLLSGLHESRIEGYSKLVEGIQVACLALKNRQNKAQKQRVVVFVGSPIKSDGAELDKLAKRLKKNGISIDFINFGEQQTNTEQLEKFISIANSNDSSHLITVPPGPNLLYEQVDRSALFQEEGGATGGLGMGDEFGFDDPNMDPELALAIRLSLEEERARQERDQPPAESNLESVKEETKEDDKMDESN